ncbi:MAG: hypothetical protein V3R68_03320, partial [Gammaproteobacteria bacterium]
RPSCLQDAGKGREQERKLEGSPSGANGTNCTFAGNAENLVRQRNQVIFKRTRATCGLLVIT